MEKALIIEDDRDISELIAIHLADMNMDVVITSYSIHYTKLYDV